MIENNLHFSKDCYFYVVEADQSEITNWGWTITNDQSSNSVVRFLRGIKMKKVSSLFDEFAAALQFPYYFGENWNAFLDCITDLDWLSGDKYIFVVLDSEQMLIEESIEQFDALITILQEAGEDWSIDVESLDALNRKSIEFYVIFQCGKGNKVQIEQKLKTVKANFQT